MANDSLRNTENFQNQAAGQNGLKILDSSATPSGVLFGVIHVAAEAVVTASNNCGYGDDFSGTTLPVGYYFGRFDEICISSGTAFAYKLTANS